MYSCSGSNYQTVCVYVCKHYFCCKVLTCESMRSDSLLDISGIIGFHQFHKKKQKTPQTFDLNVVGIFFSEVNIFHYRTQKWNLQIYKLKTLLVLNVNFGFQQTDVITSFIHFIENHFTFPSPCSFEPTVQLQSRCEQASCSSQTNCQEPPTVSTEIIFL